MRFRLAVSLKLRSSHENHRGAADRDSGRSPTKNIRQITETAGRPHPARPEPVLGRVPDGDDPAPKLAFGFPLGKSSAWRTFGSARRTIAKVEIIECLHLLLDKSRKPDPEIDFLRKCFENSDFGQPVPKNLR